MVLRGVVFIFLLLATSAQAAPRWPHEVGSGGDSVFCTAAAPSPFQGYYALDYLLTLRGDDRDLVSPRSWEESQARLERELIGKYPDLGRLFHAFAADLDNHDDYLRDHVWEQAAFGLAQLDDQMIIRKLPENCYRKGPQGEAQIIQTVIRQRRPGITIYHYDPKILQRLRELTPLQFSFLVVHEWLWDFTSDVETIRRVNRFLHSTALEKTPAHDLKRLLERLGLSLTHIESGSFCDRTPEVREAIVRRVGLPCEKIERVTGVTSLEIEGLKLDGLRPGDFLGLGELKALSLRANQLQFLFAEAFTGLYGLHILDLGANRLTHLPAGLFSQTPLLFELRLNRNRLRSLPQGIFDGLKNLELVDLGDNDLESLPDGVFHAPSGGGKIFIRLSDNRLEDLPDGMPPLSAIDKIAIGGNPISRETMAKLDRIYGKKLIWQ